MHKPKSTIEQVGIVVKQNVAEATELALEAAEFLKKSKIQVALAVENKPDFKRTTDLPFMSYEKLVETCDLIIVFGGDGTFLGIARLMINRSVPLLGVNMGQLGFLTEIKKAELFSGLTAALNGKMVISERTMLECILQRGKTTLASLPVINDIVISRGNNARIFDMQLMIDQQLVTNIKADGLIIATPTGSTAYNLAAGGPILEPTVPAMAITPICPHSLTLRPLIVQDTSQVVVSPQNKVDSVVLTLDGQKSFQMEPGDCITVGKYKKHPLKILRSPERNYFALLREKLKYGYRD